MEKLKTMLDDRYVNLKIVKELMRFKESFNKEIDAEIHSVPEFHCKMCGDTNPKQGFVPMLSSCNAVYETSMFTCNRCGMSDEHYERAFKETKDGKKLLQWMSWDGRIRVLKYIDHQHLSNIHYYMNLVHPEYYEKELKKMVRDLLMEKYGKILPYQPCPEFAYEKIRLTALGYLDRHGDIRVHGHKIGNYELGR
jgi:hypothetical protein